MLKKTCASLLMGLLLIAPASAELAVNDIIVQKLGDHDRQLKLYISNPGPSHTGPIQVHLFTRTSPNGPWRCLEKWSNENDLAPGERRMFEVSTTEGNARLLNEMREPGFEMKGVAESVPTGAVERVVTLGADKIDVGWDYGEDF